MKKSKTARKGQLFQSKKEKEQHDMKIDMICALACLKWIDSVNNKIL